MDILITDGMCYDIIDEKGTYFFPMWEPETTKDIEDAGEIMAWRTCKNEMEPRAIMLEVLDLLQSYRYNKDEDKVVGVCMSCGELLDMSEDFKILYRF